MNAENELRLLNKELELRITQRTLELQQANTLLKEANSQLTVLSETDALTKIANRHVYERRLNENFATAMRNNQDLSLLMIDIDHFKNYNDTYGHDIGDIALRKVASSIAESLPRETDLVARYGGEEFVVLLPETDSDGAYAVAETIRDNVKSLAIKHDDKTTTEKDMTISLGIASLRPSILTVNELLKQADTGLYMAKKVGGNCCEVSSA